MSALGTFGNFSGGGGGGSAIPSEDMSYGVASGTNTYSVTLSPVITTLSTGLLVSVKFTNANTSSTVTIDPNSLGATTVLNRNGGVPYIGQIQSGGVYQLVYDGTNFILQNNPYGGDVSFYRKTGTTTLERWYTSATTVYTATTVAYGANSLRAMPFVVPKTITIDRIAMEITVAGSAGSLVRIGIYDSSNALPLNLILDAGTIAGDSATFQSITINQTLVAGLYWLTWISNSATNITFRGIPVSAGVPSILGVPSNLGAGNMANHISQSYTYGPLPSTFDLSSPTASGLNLATISVRLSA